MVHPYQCPGHCANPQTGTHPLAMGRLLCHTMRVNKQHHMKLLTAIAAAVFTAVPASATPERVIVNPTEPMILVPGLEFLGYSRISTVEFCAEIENITDYTNLITDEELYNMESCLIEHT